MSRAKSGTQSCTKAEAKTRLEQVTNEKKLASLLRDVIDLKDGGHYGLTSVQVTRATSAVRKARQLVAAAEQRIR